jgi:hypothetical protein
MRRKQRHDRLRLVTVVRDEQVEIRALREEALASATRGAVLQSPCLRLCVLILDHQQREDMMLFPSTQREDSVAG